MRLTHSLLLSACIFSFAFSQEAKAVGFQTSFGGGVEIPNKGETRATAPFAQGQLATLTKVFRLQTSFTALSASGFLEAEGGIGFSIYPVSQLVSPRAVIHPFLLAMGTVGIGTYKDESRTNTGSLFGAGVDVKFWRRGGLSLSLQQHNAKEKSMRYVGALFWQREGM